MANNNVKTDIKTKEPLRIVALAPHIVEMLFDIGAGDKIVGAVAYSDYPDAALDIPRVGGYHGMQVEKILALKPDLVLVWQSGNKASDIETLERLGLNIAKSHPKQIADVAQEIRYFGGLTNTIVKAEKIALAFEEKLNRIKIENQQKKPLKTFYQLWPEPMMTVNKTTWIHQLISVCQGKNIFADNPTSYPQISIENVMIAQPEVIILPDEKSKKPQKLISWQNWPEIPAVKENNFMHVNADLLHRFSTRMLQGLEDMCTKMDAFR